MGYHFGNLQRLKGVTYYSLSPTELKAFHGILFPGIKNTLRRFSENIFPIGIPFAAWIVGVIWFKEKLKAQHHKNPEDFKDEI